MKKYFKVTYEVVGGSKNDFMLVWASDIEEAIKDFEQQKFTAAGVEFNYSKHAILKIEVQ